MAAVPRAVHTVACAGTKTTYTVDVRYSNLKYLGGGAYGTVASAEDAAAGGERVALKKVSDVLRDAFDAKRALREVKLLRGLSHPNIVTLLDVFRQGGKLYLCFEYLEKTGGVGLVGWGREVGAALGLVSPTGSPARPSWRVLGACVCSPSA